MLSNCHWCIRSFTNVIKQGHYNSYIFSWSSCAFVRLDRHRSRAIEFIFVCKGFFSQIHLGLIFFIPLNTHNVQINIMFKPWKRRKGERSQNSRFSLYKSINIEIESQATNFEYILLKNFEIQVLIYSFKKVNKISYEYFLTKDRYYINKDRTRNFFLPK